MKVTIIGAGNMGRGIGTRMVAGGNEVEVIDRDPDEARALAQELGDSASASDTVSGEVVILALPYEAVAPAVSQHRDRLVGKVVIDIVNPADWSTMDRLVTPEGSSAAEEIAKLLPEGTRVVKAFNTTFAPTLVAGEAAGGPLDVLIAGDDESAKRDVASLVEAGGMRPIDVGPLKRARQLEQMGLFHIAVQQDVGSNFGSALRLQW
jgi:NADPH-dependent F420 reductase